MKESICWYCKNAYAICPWAKNFKPITGWEAEPTTILNNSKGYVCETQSYIVHACPHYAPDSIPKKQAFQIAKNLGVSIRTYQRHKRAGTLNKLIDKHNKKNNQN